MVKLLGSVVERLRSDSVDSSVDSQADPVERRLLSIAADVFEDQRGLTLDSTKSDVIGWDSLGNMNLVVALEDEFDIEFDEADLHNADSLRDLYDALQRKLQ